MRRLAIIVLALVVLGGSALADAKWGGVARELAMGGSQASSGVILNPFIVHDPSLMLLNPAYQTQYKDYIWMNIGGGALNNLSTTDNGYGNQYSGLNFSLSKEVSVGAILSFDPSAVNAVSSLIKGVTISGVTLPPFTQRTAQTIPAVQNVFEGLVSFDLGDLDVGFGASVGWSNNSTKTSTVTPATSGEREASAKVFGFRGGILYDLGGGSSIDLSAGIRLDKATDNIKSNAGSGGEYSASGTEIQFAVRAALKVNNKVSFVPYGVVATASAEPKEDAPPAGTTAQRLSEKLSLLAYAVGAGAEYRLPNFYLAGGLSLQAARAKEEASTAGTTGSATLTYTYTALPVFNIGAEWWWTDWLAGRGGYYRALGSVSSKSETPGGTTETDQTIPNSFVLVGGIGPTTWDGLVTLGLGLKFGNFSLDATVSEEALRRGLGLIGAQDNINTFGYITTSFNFQ